MDTREWLLTAAVILVPLAIAVVVTLWSLKQVQYRRKVWRPPAARPDAASGEPGTRAPASGDTDAS